ncbi:hypothetical protein KAU08_02380, partial [bacterium]|nr:hypothetical protein [bacterium]
MKWSVITAASGILLFLILGCGGGSSTPVTPDLSIRVISPNGNEQWEPGDEHEISWTSNISSGSVLIEYSNDGFAADINTIATVPAVDGSYLWFVPDDASPSVRVRISSSDMPSVSDMSDAGFTIVQPELKILSPRGGEEFKVGRECQIEWTTEYPNSAVLIEYSTDNFVDDIQFVATDFVPGIPMGNYSGEYSWEVDLSPSEIARIRVSIHEKQATLHISPEFKILHSGWAESWGTNRSEYPGGIDVDASGNIYISGKMGNQNGTENAFLAKYTTSSQLVWAKTWCEV